MSQILDQVLRPDKNKCGSRDTGVIAEVGAALGWVTCGVCVQLHSLSTGGRTGGSDFNSIKGCCSWAVERTVLVQGQQVLFKVSLTKKTCGEAACLSRLGSQHEVQGDWPVLLPEAPWVVPGFCNGVEEGPHGRRQPTHRVAGIGPLHL